MCISNTERLTRNIWLSLFGTLLPYLNVLVRHPRSAMILAFLHYTAQEKADNGPSTWISIMQLVNPDQLCEFYFYPDPALAFGGIWGVNQWRVYYSLSLYLSNIIIYIEIYTLKILNKIYSYTQGVVKIFYLLECMLRK